MTAGTLIAFLPVLAPGRMFYWAGVVCNGWPFTRPLMTPTVIIRYCGVTVHCSPVAAASSRGGTPSRRLGFRSWSSRNESVFTVARKLSTTWSHRAVADVEKSAGDSGKGGPVLTTNGDNSLKYDLVDQ